MPQFQRENPRKFKVVAIIATVLAVGVGIIAYATTQKSQPQQSEESESAIEHSDRNGNNIFNKALTPRTSKVYRSCLVNDFELLPVPNTLEAYETYETYETYEMSETYETYEMSEMSETYETYETYEMSEMSETYETYETYETHETYVDSVEEPEEYVIPCSDEEFDYLVQLVLHEVGDDPTYFPIGDIDIIQQCIVSCVINRTASEYFPDSVFEVLMQPGQFLDISELSSFDTSNERTRENVLKVLRGESEIPKDLFFEMGFFIQDENGNLTYDPEQAKELAEFQVGSVELFYSAYSVEGVTCVFMRKT